MEGEKLDLSALDPMRDPGHWRGVVGATLRRVDAVLAERVQRQDPLQLIAGWMRPVLLAAAAVIAFLVPVEIALERREADAERVQRLVTLSTGWAQGEQQPTGAELLRVVSEARVR